MSAQFWERFIPGRRTPRPAPQPAPQPSIPEQDIPDAPPPPVASGGPVRVIQVTWDGNYRPRMMSDRANAFVRDRTVFVFAGRNDGPQFFKVDLDSGDVTWLGPLVPYPGETEGWHWRPDGKLYVLDGPRLRCLNPFDRSDDEIVLDISDRFPGCNLWQPHSSDSGTVLSATVQRNEGGKICTILKHPGGVELFEPQGELDESQVTRDGAYLVIKEKIDGADGNRVITVANVDEERRILDHERGVQHSDCGYSILIGEADKPDPGACVLWDLREPLTMDRCRILFHTLNMGYVSYRGGRLLHSGATHLSLVDVQSGTLTQLIEHGAPITNDYDLRVKASLSPCARVATYMVNGNVYLLVL